MKPIVLYEGQLIDLRTALTGLVRGIEVHEGWPEQPGRHHWTPSRPTIAKRIAQVAWAAFDWWAALPGDVFWELDRDRYLIVHSGVGSRRRVHIWSGPAWHHYRGRQHEAPHVAPEPYTTRGASIPRRAVR